MDICQSHRRLARRLLVGLVALFAGAAPTIASGAGTDKVVPTDRGPVRGIATPTENIFLGIPYAAPPVGDLRWKPPQSRARWTTPRDATRLANHCAQSSSPFEAGGIATNTEDCLYLNVFTPGHIDRGVPHRHAVMVWIHGGGLSTGQSDTYIPTRLVEQGDVIVVTINYRLGILGFLGHPALTAESPDHVSSNYGLMDQQFALTWVQRNIAAFGGDPGNVTIFGESAGGLSVHANLASPTAAGLFHKAIIQSGAYSLTQPSLGTVEASGVAFAAAVGCGSQTAACLRALSVSTILAAQAALVTTAGFVPAVDGKVLTQSVGAALLTGQFNRVPVIEGSNHDEFRSFVATSALLAGALLTAADYVPAIASTLGVDPGTAAFLAGFYPLAAYPPPILAPSLGLSAIGTDAIFACNARLVANTLARYVPVYQYEFNDPHAPVPLAAPPLPFPLRAYHSSELSSLFDFTLVGFPPLNPDQEQLSDAMVRYWTRFARSGDPNAADVPPWPAHGASDLFQSLEPPTPSLQGGFSADHKCALYGTP